MAKEEKIQTLHPDPNKKGTNIAKYKYDQVRQAILDSLAQEEEMTFYELLSVVESRLDDHFEGSISWYYTTVKLDLEARGVIERKPSGSPQLIRLASK